MYAAVKQYNIRQPCIAVLVNYMKMSTVTKKGTTGIIFLQTS